MRVNNQQKLKMFIVLLTVMQITSSQSSLGSLLPEINEVIEKGKSNIWA